MTDQPRREEQLRPEFALLRCCARTAMSPAHVESARALLGRGLDWQLLCRASIEHGVMPLLYRNLVALGPSLCPPDFLAELREAYVRNVASSLRMTAELKTVLGLFEANGIPALPFKGPVLAAYAYGDVPLRQYGDLDLLVPPSELERAVNLLRARGYNPVEPMTARQQRAHVRRKMHLKLRDPAGSFTIELHWRFSPPVAPENRTRRRSSTADSMPGRSREPANAGARRPAALPLPARRLAPLGSAELHLRCGASPRHPRGLELAGIARQSGPNRPAACPASRARARPRRPRSSTAAGSHPLHRRRGERQGDLCRGQAASIRAANR